MPLEIGDELGGAAEADAAREEADLLAGFEQQLLRGFGAQAAEFFAKGAPGKSRELARKVPFAQFQLRRVLRQRTRFGEVRA